MNRVKWCVRGLPTFWRGEEVGTPRLFLTDVMRVWRSTWDENGYATPGAPRQTDQAAGVPLRSCGLFFVAGHQERKKIRDYQWVFKTCQFFDYFFAAER